MKIKNLLIALISIYSFNALAQDSKAKEIGLTMYDFDNFGMIYKIGNSEKMWRFRILTGGFTSNLNYVSATTYKESSNTYLNFSFGREKRRSINNKLNFIYGVELTGGFRYNEEKTYLDDILLNGGKQISFNTGIVGVIGMSYLIKDKLILGVELLPYVIYSRSKSSPYISNSSELTSNSIQFEGRNAFLSFGIKF